MTQRPSLNATNVSRIYAGQTVLNGASLSLEPGTITALLGQSGAGKSTLLRLFAGLERPDSGTIALGDTVLSDKARMVPAEKRRVGLIFQDFALFPHLTAQQNVAFGLTHMPKQDALALAAQWLERIDLSARAGAFPYQMSGGEKQRVAIARALAPEPVAILMDEPFSGLDPALREDVRTLALNTVRASGTPALLVTHDASEAMLSADRLAIMRNGVILQNDTPETVYSKPASLDVATALGPILYFELDATTNQGTQQTPLGPFPLAVPQSKRVKIGIRPEGVLIDAASSFRASVVSVRRTGPMQHVCLRVDDFTADILVPHTSPLATQQDVGLRLDPQSCVIFA